MCRVSDYRVYMYIDFVSLAKVLYTHHFRMNVTSIAQRTSERGLEGSLTQPRRCERLLAQNAILVSLMK